MKYCIFVLMMSVVPALNASANPLNFLKREIKKQGYLLYRSPLAHSGTGTLVGGTPRAMQTTVDPQRCFPDYNADESPTDIRKVEEMSIGSISQTTEFEGKVGLDLIQFMNTGNSVFTIGVGGSVIQTVNLQIEGAKHEYLDTLALQNYYHEGMPVDCKRALNDFGFVIDALRVDRMVYSFKDKGGVYLKLNTEAVSQYFNIDLDVKYHIEQDYLLVIDSPKYLGYRLGRLREKDNGYALFRSNQTLFNRWIFKSSSIFQH